ARLGEPTEPALIHRDLHDKQILWQPDAPPGLLDVDTATLGDPALDIANLRTHATWRELQGLWSAEQSAVVREEIDRTALRLDILPDALAAYESGTTARLACVYAFRPRWHRGAHPRRDPRTGRPGPPVGPRSAGGPRRPHHPVRPRTRGLHPLSRPRTCGTHHPPGRQRRPPRKEHVAMT